MRASEMTERIGRNYWMRSAVLAVGVASLIAMIGCSLEAHARRSFKKIVYQEIKQFNKYNRKEEKPRAYKTDEGFYRIYKERIEPTTNMRRTNSIDTPFIATLVFTENVYVTHRHKTMTEARGDSHYILSDSSKREILYTFVDGGWKKKQAR